jgi:hypothetical protein
MTVLLLWHSRRNTLWTVCPVSLGGRSQIGTRGAEVPWSSSSQTRNRSSWQKMDRTYFYHGFPVTVSSCVLYSNRRYPYSGTGAVATPPGCRSGSNKAMATSDKPAPTRSVALIPSVCTAYPVMPKPTMPPT